MQLLEAAEWEALKEDLVDYLVQMVGNSNEAVSSILGSPSYSSIIEDMMEDVLADIAGKTLQQVRKFL